MRCLDSENKLKGRIAELEADYDEVKEKNGGLELELEYLKGCIIQEHINGFKKCLRQATFFYKDIDVSDSKFNVNKNVVDGALVSEVGSSPEEETDKVAEGPNAKLTMLWRRRMLMRKRLRTYVLGFIFDFKPKSVIIHTLL